MQKVGIGSRSAPPSRILDEGVVRAEVHLQLSARAVARHELRGHAHGDPAVLRRPVHAVCVLHEALRLEHRRDHRLIVVGLSVRAVFGLQETVIALRIEQPLLVEARALEAVVDVRRDHEIVLAAHKLQQPVIHRPRRGDEAIIVDMPAPPRPARFGVGERIKAAGIHIPDSEALRKIEEVPRKALSRVGVARRGREPRARADHDGVRLFKRGAQTAQRLFGVFASPPAGQANGLHAPADRFAVAVGRLRRGRIRSGAGLFRYEH